MLRYQSINNRDECSVPGCTRMPSQSKGTRCDTHLALSRDGMADIAEWRHLLAGWDALARRHEQRGPARRRR